MARFYVSIADAWGAQVHFNLTLGPGSPTREAGQAIDRGRRGNALCGAIGFLAACGVYGEEMRREALRKFQPMLPQ